MLGCERSERSERSERVDCLAVGIGFAKYFLKKSDLKKS
jgi:hypothetical protein